MTTAILAGLGLLLLGLRLNDGLGVGLGVLGYLLILAACDRLAAHLLRGRGNRIAAG